MSELDPIVVFAHNGNGVGVVSALYRTIVAIESALKSTRERFAKIIVEELKKEAQSLVVEAFGSAIFLRVNYNPKINKYVFEFLVPRRAWVLAKKKGIDPLNLIKRFEARAKARGLSGTLLIAPEDLD